MKNRILFIVWVLILVSLISCSHTPSKIENYINNSNLRSDTCIDLQEALKIDYDVMFVFDSFTPLTGVRKIIGIPDYGNYEAPENVLVCADSEKCKLILIKKGKVVLDDEYCYNDYNTKILYHDFDSVIVNGTFDGDELKVKGYIYKEPKLKLIRNSGVYLLTKIENMEK